VIKSFLVDALFGIFLLGCIILFHVFAKGLFLPALDFYRSLSTLPSLIKQDSILVGCNFLILAIHLFFAVLCVLICSLFKGYFNESMNFADAIIISVVPFFSLLSYRAFNAWQIVFQEGNNQSFLNLLLSSNNLNLVLQLLANSIVLTIGTLIGWFISKAL
jgi:hypothetical protein